MGDNELETVRTLEAYREMIAEVIRNYRGRVVDSPGDNILAEFLSVVDAVESAVEIQKELKAKNAELPENRRMEFRIGINLGDVIEEGERIYGEGVNIAARLEGLSEGGGICISGTAFDQVETKLGLDFEYLGEQAVKNIKKPVRVYRAKMESGVSDVELSRELPLPDKPSIAILPFVNMSGDPEQEYFSDGITEEIITALSRTPKLFVIARNSTFTYKGKSVKVQKLAEELGVQYVLEGSVRKSGDRVRITAQLIDAITGRHLWAERYDRDLKDIFALQDEVAVKIMSAIGAELTRGERALLLGKGTDNVEAYLKVLQGFEYWYRQTEETNLQARKLGEEAIGLDPEFPSAYCLLAATHFMEVLFGSTKSPRKSLREATKLYQQALAIDESHPIAIGALAYVYALQSQYDKAIAQAERAVALNPNRANPHLGMVLFHASRYREAIFWLKKAIRLDPKGPGYYFLYLGRAYRELGQYGEAIAELKKALGRQPEMVWAHIDLAATYSLAGREEDARAAASDVLNTNPKFSLEGFAKSFPYKNQAHKERYIDALRKAGLR
jgi:adenylate cyclase